MCLSNKTAMLLHLICGRCAVWHSGGFVPVSWCPGSAPVALWLCFGALGPLRWLCTYVLVPWVRFGGCLRARRSGGFVPVCWCQLGPLRRLLACVLGAETPRGLLASLLHLRSFWGRFGLPSIPGRLTDYGNDWKGCTDGGKGCWHFHVFSITFPGILRKPLHYHKVPLSPVMENCF